MIFFRKTHFPKFNIFGGALCALALIGVIADLRAQQPDGTSLPMDGRAPSGASDGWQSGETVHLIGLPAIREKEKGSLSISPVALTFASPGGRASVQRAEILNVSIGDVNVETGGTAGKITRAMIPFGGGSVLATVTHKQFGLLTIEFRDQHGALHGAVFLLPKDESLQAQMQLGEQTSPHSIQPPHGPCETNGVVSADSIKVAAITTLGTPVPAEYKTSIYEQLVSRLRQEGRFTAVYRDGDDDPKAACPKYNVVLTLDAFKKGNAVVRASTGPVGFFVGATSLKFQVQVQARDGRMLLDRDLNASQRGDTDSLNIADKIAKSLTKEIKKAGMHAARS
jgi:hypothetical protein